MTDYAIDSLVSGIVCLVVIAILSVVPTYGMLLAFLFGLALIILGVIRLVGIWGERSERPLFWFVLLVFGAVFEFGSVTDIASVLPFCLIIDVIVLAISLLVAAMGPIVSAVSDLWHAIL